MFDEIKFFSTHKEKSSSHSPRDIFDRENWAKKILSARKVYFFLFLSEYKSVSKMKIAYNSYHRIKDQSEVKSTQWIVKMKKKFMRYYTHLTLKTCKLTWRRKFETFQQAFFLLSLFFIKHESSLKSWTNAETQIQHDVRCTRRRTLCFDNLFDSKYMLEFLISHWT